MNSKEEMEIQPLPVPCGISTDDLVKMVFNILYRKALIVTDKWAHWVLLAAVQILEKNTAPPLDVKSLCLLQGFCEKDVFSPLKGQGFKPSQDGEVSATEKVNDDLTKDTPKKKRLSGMSDRASKMKKIENTEVSGENQEENTVAPCETKQNVASEVNIVDKKKEVAEKGIQAGTSKHSFACQVSPKMLGITSNKWTQMWKRRRNNKSCQTDDMVQYKLVSKSRDAQTQVDLLADNKGQSSSDRKNTVHRETQTIIVHRKDISCQYSYKAKSKKEPRMSWRLIPISGLPDRRKSRCDASANVSVKFSDSLEFRDNGAPSSLVDPEYGVDLGSVPDAEGGSLINHQLSQSLFYGRLMITSKSKIDAPDIPLNPIDSFLLNDPRNTENQ